SFNEPVGVPYPSGEQSDADDVRAKRSDFGDDPVVALGEVARGRIDDANVAAVPNERRRDVLLAEERSPQLFRRGRIDEKNAREIRVAKGGPASTMFPPITCPTGTYGGANEGTGPFPSTPTIICVGS